MDGREADRDGCMDEQIAGYIDNLWWLERYRRLDGWDG
jgi:hypothetical protein